MPLWSGVLGIVRPISDDPVAGRLLVVVFGALSVVLVARLARRLYGAKVGWTAGFIAAIFPDHIFWSHYLWSEIFLGTLILASCLAFLPVDQDEKPNLKAAGLMLGFSLLAKDFTLIAFVAFVVAIIAGRAGIGRRQLIGFVSLFLLPLAVYSVVYRIHNKTNFKPWITPVASMRVNVGLSFSVACGADGDFTRQLKKYNTTDFVKKMSSNLQRLWGSRSFVTWRVSTGQYRRVVPHWIVTAIVISHSLVIFLGIVGLVGDDDPFFKPFAVSCILLLSLLAPLAFLVSRYRVPFMFIFVIEAARAWSDPMAAENILRSRRRLVASVVLVGMFTVLILGALSSETLGTWG